MSRYRRFSCLVLASVLWTETVPLFAFSGTEGASFLELPVGARPAAMGSAYTPLAEDAYAPTWNPAGLAFLEVPQVAAMHMIYLESTSFEYGSFVTPLGQWGGVGFAVQYFQPGDIAGLDASANPIGDITGYYANYTLAAGAALGPHLGLGVSGNMIRAKIDDVSAHAFAGSGGLLFRPNDQWRWAAVIANAGQKLKFLSAEDSLPLTYRFGAAYHPRPAWTFAAEGAKEKGGVSSGHLGAEYETPFGFSFRMGYNTERVRQLSALAGLSLGISMLPWNQDFSYTWMPLSELGSSHILSMVWHFGRVKASSEDTPKLQRPPTEEDMDFRLDR